MLDDVPGYGPQESPVITDETDELKDLPNVPTQEEENEVIGINTLEENPPGEYKDMDLYKIIEDGVVVLGETKHNGEVVCLPKIIGEKLVEDLCAENVESSS